MKYKFSSWIFIAMFILMAGVYNYHKILFFRPMSEHQWRQCDCLSITLNYFKENRSFFKPSTCWLSEKGTGQTVSEFPIIYFTVGKLWKIFGQHEFIFRGLDVLLLFISLFLLFKTFERFLENSFWATGLVMLLFTSPIWVYYGNNFLADIPALSLSIIGWFYFMKFYREGRNKYFLIAMFFYLLAGLIKISSLISFVSIGGVFFIETIFNKHLGEGRKIFSKPAVQFIPFVILVIIIAAWLKFVFNYNEAHNSGIFLTGILPIWDFPAKEVKWVWDQFRHSLIYTFYSKYMLLFTLACLILCLGFYKKTNKFLLSINIFMTIGALLFFILWYDVFQNHDYYMSNLLMWPVMIIFNISMLVKNNYPRLLHSKIFKSVFVVFLCLNIFYAAGQNSIRYFMPSGNTIYSWVIPQDTLILWRYIHRYYNERIKAIETIEPYNRSLGIKRTDRVISIPDETINVTLYLMDQKGYSDFGYGTEREEKVKRYVNMGAKYLFINDTIIYSEPWIAPYLKNKIGSYKNVDIYKVGE